MMYLQINYDQVNDIFRYKAWLCAGIFSFVASVTACKTMVGLEKHDSSTVKSIWIPQGGILVK